MTMRFYYPYPYQDAIKQAISIDSEEDLVKLEILKRVQKMKFTSIWINTSRPSTSTIDFILSFINPQYLILQFRSTLSHMSKLIIQASKVNLRSNGELGNPNVTRRFWTPERIFHIKQWISEVDLKFAVENCFRVWHHRVKVLWLWLLFKHGFNPPRYLRRLYCRGLLRFQRAHICSF